MKPFWCIGISVLFGLSICIGACRHDVSLGELAAADSLNEVAYSLRYKSLLQSRQAAEMAYEMAAGNGSARAEACNHLGFCAFMEMDFTEAERCFQQVYTLTKNELELLIADIGWMKICQRKAMNKEFYDYRNRALRHMKRIAEDANLFVEPHERLRLSFAKSEFYLVSAVYYYYLQQQSDALACIRQAREVEGLRADTNQLLSYHYIKGAAELCEGELMQVRWKQAFDELQTAWRLAVLQDNRYFMGNSLQGMANLMMEAGRDSLSPFAMAQRALRYFQEYRDPYQVAGTYVTIGNFLNRQGRYDEALDTLALAMECVNHLKGMAPECMSRICEQMSVSYAGLGEKAASDYHRNLYLDILEDTRQDKELESRYQALESEAKQLNVLMMAVWSGLVAMVVFFWVYNRRAKLRSRRHVERLQLMLDLCQHITSAIPAEVQSEEELVKAIIEAVRPGMVRLFGTEEVGIKEGEMVLDKRLTKDEQAMLSVLNPYVQWALDNGQVSISLGDEQKRLEKKRYVYEQHMAEQKRQNMVKKTCLAIVNGIQPYIVRMLNVVQKVKMSENLESEQQQERFLYLEELVDAIHESNEILTRWIQLKKGSLNLNIETFELDELFDVLRKGSRAFELKGQILEVESAGVVVKADKALTMFMLNTLTDNARKYTPRGSRVKVSAQVSGEYVEISVEDNGMGIPAEKMEELRQNKGQGFGLMNCRGIIEKYRKTSALFKVCLFGMESELQKGSRFFFRLPVGIRKTLLLVAAVWSGTMSLQANGDSRWTTPEQEEYEALLDSASDYANEAYFCNVDGDYEDALQYIDSSMQCLNKHYLRFSSHPKRIMKLMEEVQPAEWDWWIEPFNSDFHIILDIRNEAAVAFLALKRWKEYAYNNRAYTTLYKLLGEDQSLESYCRELERSSRNKVVGIWLTLFVAFVWLLGYSILYVRKRLVNRWNLEQVLEINRQVYAAAQPLQTLPQQLVEAAFEAVNDLLGIDGLYLAVCTEDKGKLELAARTKGKSEWENSQVESLIYRCFQEEKYLNVAGWQAWPLKVDVAGHCSCIGVLCLNRTEGTEQETDGLLLELIARYVAVVAYNAVVKLATKYRDIELAEDEVRRASWEDNVLHVQNMVLDNCLSTIKHETVYYPNKIKQLIGKMRQSTLSAEERVETVKSIEELMVYYKEIYTLLSQCAARQLEEVMFRRSVVDVSVLLKKAEKFFYKVGRNGSVPVRLSVKLLDAKVLGDVNLLQFLLESLLEEALTVSLPGDLSLWAEQEGEMIRFCLTDYRRSFAQEELNQWFYPSRQRMQVDDRGHLHGTEYLIAKQIIRDHDEYAGRRGCRIYATANAEGGFTVCFTVYLVKSEV